MSELTYYMKKRKKERKKEKKQESIVKDTICNRLYLGYLELPGIVKVPPLTNSLIQTCLPFWRCSGGTIRYKFVVCG